MLSHVRLKFSRRNTVAKIMLEYVLRRVGFSSEIQLSHKTK